MIEFSYQNYSKNLLVLRCVGPKNFFLERVIFPYQIIVLTAPEDSKVEIWGHEINGARLEERFRINDRAKDTSIAA